MPLLNRYLYAEYSRERGCWEPDPEGRREHAQDQRGQSSWCVNSEEDVIQGQGFWGITWSLEAIVGTLPITPGEVGIQCKVLGRGVSCSLWLLPRVSSWG